MLWDDDFLPRAQQLVKKIREIKAKNLITIAEGAELNSLYEELDKLQKNCSHSYTVILLFNRHRRFCRLCDKEDHSYKHHD